MADTIARALARTETEFPIDIPPNRAHTFGNVAGNITETAAGDITASQIAIRFPLQSTIVVPLSHLPGG
jgi:hypothetical protein